MKKNRREFIKISGAAGVGLSLISPFYGCSQKTDQGIKFGLVTYQWGKDWDLPTLISNCEQIGYKGVELRTEHAHGVEISLTATQRADVKKRFTDSPVTCVGFGSNFEYHDPDPKKLRWNIEQTKEYIKLCHDIGATGIKVKPNTFPVEVEREKTIEQIAASLNEVGKFAKNYDQLIRVEVHGPITSKIPNMKAIFDYVTEDNVKMCWNSVPSDIQPPGLEANFSSVKQWIGDTVHVHSLNKEAYPYQELFKLLKEINFNGWILLEEGAVPDDIIGSMQEQIKIFNDMIIKI